MFFKLTLFLQDVNIIFFSGSKNPNVFIILYVKVRCVIVSVVRMRRILSASLLRHFSLFGRIPLCRIGPTEQKRSPFYLNFCNKTTSNGGDMDLSNMRKKYKGDEEVSCIQSRGGQWCWAIKAAVWRCKVMPQYLFYTWILRP